MELHWVRGFHWRFSLRRRTITHTLTVFDFFNGVQGNTYTADPSRPIARRRAQRELGRARRWHLSPIITPLRPRPRPGKRDSAGPRAGVRYSSTAMYLAQLHLIRVPSRAFRGSIVCLVSSSSFPQAVPVLKFLTSCPPVLSCPCGEVPRNGVSPLTLLIPISRYLLSTWGKQPAAPRKYLRRRSRLLAWLGLWGR